MEHVVVPLAALVASALTLFSGFGLGTLLMPVVALFFPVEVAIAIGGRAVELCKELERLVFLLFPVICNGRIIQRRSVVRILFEHSCKFRKSLVEVRFGPFDERRTVI